jgi:hypothetical protein
MLCTNLTRNSLSMWTALSMRNFILLQENYGTAFLYLA